MIISLFLGYFLHILDLFLQLGLAYGVPKASPSEGGVRIMDLDQYLEKMNTNTKII